MNRTSSWTARLASVVASVLILGVGSAAANAVGTTPDPAPTTSIIGGTPVTADYPVVRVYTTYPTGERYMCSGSLVSHLGRPGIVTGAHCATTFDTGAAMPADSIDIRYGSTVAAELVSVIPTRVEILPGWDWATGDGDVEDLAVLALPDTIDLKGIGLSATNLDPARVLLVGWGITDIDGGPADTLQQLDTRIIDDAACASAGITGGELCIAPTATGGSACFGDSGGPALARTHRLSHSERLIGSASRETTSDCTGPTVYTDVRAYASWIRAALLRPQPRPRTRTLPEDAAAKFLASAA